MLFKSKSIKNRSFFYSILVFFRSNSCDFTFFCIFAPNYYSTENKKNIKI